MPRVIGHTKAQEAGFTLMELIVVILLIGVIIVVAEMPLNVGVRSYVTGQQFLSAHENGRRVVWRMERDLRNMRKGALALADSASITFDDAYQELTTFSLSGDQLMRNGNVLADAIAALTFAYYDADNNVLGPLPLDAANLANVYRISYDIAVTSGGETYRFREQIFPRDLRN